ncbi:macro domain-containing protein [Holophaga foetida]|uniref:macro domain-containing protein n=1 Tax=Holophaga foetida TaxID=35839 RepID=UPI000247498F|nr:macro domain-containing protein [Holophaga foetida]
MIRFKLQLGDITTMEMDAIVNSTDTTMLDGGPVHQAVHKAAGPEFTMECELVGNCPVGEARLTSGHGLPARLVIHTVAPTWLDGNQGEREALASCYENALRLAEVRGVSSLAFPSLGAGRLPQIPLHEAAPVAVGTILNFLDRHEYPNQVVLVCYDTDTFQAYQKALKAALP